MMLLPWRHDFSSATSQPGVETVIDMASDPSETDQLSQAVDSGDRRQVDRMLDEHREFLRQVVALRMDRQITARVDPSDVVQEAQLEAVRRLDDYLKNPAMPLRLWLRRIVCDRLIMEQRRHIDAQRRSVKREIALPEGSSADIGHQLLADIASPSGALSRKEIARQVRQAMAELPENDREILLLQNFEGLTSPESAQVLGIEPAAARKRYGRALLRLRQRLVTMGLGGSGA